MNWKAFITACISTAIVSFPQNIIGCGPGVDPYDYYTSFFHQNLPETNGYKPFYYTGYNFFYDIKEPASVPDLLAAEWAAYSAAPVKIADAKKLVNKFAWKDLNNLYFHIEKNQALNTRLCKTKQHDGLFYPHKRYRSPGLYFVCKTGRAVCYQLV